ncbi:uncharacterized protein [Procambarus clarkii]|uniref:uncharacterized protein isoform X2 n=1 Tax=Procambarus clarkii TaxID=6728 RepID=UPI001E676B68|nr:uncharacterized protein LOC123773639 isoform X2 [Procambarus clarkii]
MAPGGVTMLVVVTVMMALLPAGAPQTSGVAISSVVDDNGIVSGECAYINGRGEPIKIRFRESPTGQIEANADSASVRDAVAELRVCRQAAAAVNTRLSQQQRELEDVIYRSIPFNLFRRR